MQGVFTASQAGAALAQPGLSATFATDRFRRFAMAGLVASIARAHEGRRAAQFFEPNEVAIAALLFACFDNAGITEHVSLKALRDHLLTDTGGVPYIERVTFDVREGGQPQLWLTKWRNADGAETLVYSVRLSGELGMPIDPPGAEWTPLLQGAIPLAPLLERLTGANVVPLKAIN